MLRKPRIIIVTAGRNQAPLIRKASELGYEVLVTDADPLAASAGLADHAERVDASDFRSLLRLSEAYKPQAIISEQTDVAVQAVARVADELGLPGIGHKAAVRATDKWEMREACANAGLKTPAYRLIRSATEAMAAADAIGLPVVIKPVDSQSSKGVTKVNDRGDITDAARRAIEGSRSGRALVEEQMSGPECSVESFIADGKITILGISEKTKSEPPFSYDLQLIYPGRYSREQYQALTDFNANLIAAIGIRMGFVHAELIMTSGGVRLIEVAARGCGARVATDLLPQLTGIDLLAARIRQAAGHKIELPVPRHDQVGILRFFEFQAGSVIGIDGVTAAVSQPGVLHLEIAPKIGTVLAKPQSGDQRHGFFLATSASRKGAIELANKVTAAVRVDIDPAGATAGHP